MCQTIYILFTLIIQNILSEKFILDTKDIKQTKLINIANLEFWNFIIALKFSTGKFCIGTLVSTNLILTDGKCTENAIFVYGLLDATDLNHDEGQLIYSDNIITKTAENFKTKTDESVSLSLIIITKGYYDIFKYHGIQFVSSVYTNVTEYNEYNETTEKVLDAFYSVQYGINNYWDIASFKKISNITLYSCKLHVVKLKYCSTMFDVEDIHICTLPSRSFGTSEEEKPCFAIGGAPLMIKRILFGVLASGQVCDQNFLLPALWVRTDFFFDWILDNIEKYSNEANFGELKNEKRTPLYFTNGLTKTYFNTVLFVLIIKI